MVDSGVERSLEHTAYARRRAELDLQFTRFSAAHQARNLVGGADSCFRRSAVPVVKPDCALVP